MTDTFYLQNRIQLEANNLQRNHVYYSIDEQPEVCARLIAEAMEADEADLEADLDEVFDLINETWEKNRAKREAEYGPNYGSENLAKQMLRGGLFGHRVSVTVQSWDDVPAAIGLIRERQREFKKGMR